MQTCVLISCVNSSRCFVEEINRLVLYDRNLDYKRIKAWKWKKLEHGIKIQTKTDSYLGSKFNLTPANKKAILKKVINH